MGLQGEYWVISDLEVVSSPNSPSLQGRLVGEEAVGLGLLIAATREMAGTGTDASKAPDRTTQALRV